MNVLITGGTGLIGRRLTEILQAIGHQVRHLSRRPAPDAPVPTYHWDPAAGTLDTAALDNLDAIVHLAGAGVADQRWTDVRKSEIVDSRVETARLLREALQTRNQSLPAFLSASAVGYYGADTGDRRLTEDAPPAHDFLAYVTQMWEAAADTFAEGGTRVVKLRIGVVLSADGGALPQLARPVRWGAGAPLGTGQQYLSWVHIDDVARMFAFALETPTLSGTYNAVGPTPVTNDTFTHVVAEVLDRPYFLPPVPGFLLYLALGEMATVVLGGNRVSSEKIAAAGFTYRYPELTHALSGLLTSDFV